MRRSRDLKPWEGVCVTLIGAADRRGAADWLRGHVARYPGPLPVAICSAMGAYVSERPRPEAAPEWTPCQNAAYRDPSNPYGVVTGRMCGRPARIYRDDRPGYPSHAVCDYCGRVTVLLPGEDAPAAPARPAPLLVPEVWDDSQPWDG